MAEEVAMAVGKLSSSAGGGPSHGVTMLVERPLLLLLAKLLR